MTRKHSSLDVFAVDCDHQREWIERRGLFLLLALYLGGVGGGLFLVSLVIGWKVGLVIALGIVGIGKGGAHLLFLGKPLRAWRAFWRPQSSWLSRGIYFVALFLIFGIIHYFYQDNDIIRVIAGFFAVALISYTGFLLAASPGISFWNTPLLPVVFAAASMASGAALAGAVHAIRPETLMTNIDRLEPLALAMVTAVVAIIFVYLVADYTSTVAAKESVVYLAWSGFAPVFYAGVVLLGIIIPLAILVPAYLGEVNRGWLAAAGISELAGSFVLRFSLLKAGIYPKVI